MRYQLSHKIHEAVYHDDYEYIEHIITTTISKAAAAAASSMLPIVDIPSDHRMRSPLYTAAHLGRIRSLRALMSNNAANPFVMCNRNMMPIHAAAKRGNTECMFELLDYMVRYLEQQQQQQQREHKKLNHLKNGSNTDNIAMMIISSSFSHKKMNLIHYTIKSRRREQQPHQHQQHQTEAKEYCAISSSSSGSMKQLLLKELVYYVIGKANASAESDSLKLMSMFRARDKYLRTPLFMCAYYGCYDMMAFMLNNVYVEPFFTKKQLNEDLKLQCLPFGKDNKPDNMNCLDAARFAMFLSKRYDASAAATASTTNKRQQRRRCVESATQCFNHLYIIFNQHL